MVHAYREALGYTDGANSWEPEANILDETLIRVFEKRQAAELDALAEPALRKLLGRAGLVHDYATREELLVHAAEACAVLAPQPSVAALS